MLLFIFVKRQIMRFAVKSRRGPHAPVGHNAPKVKELSYSLLCWSVHVLIVILSELDSFTFFQDLKEEIDSRLFKVNNLRYEPRLLSEDDVRLKHRGQSGEKVPSHYMCLYSDIPYEVKMTFRSWRDAHKKCCSHSLKSSTIMFSSSK